MSMEIVTTTDKDQRDRLFEDLRKNGNELERQVVKFSSVEPILGPDGKQDGYWKHYRITGHEGEAQFRPYWQSNWSVAYPTS